MSKKIIVMIFIIFCSFCLVSAVSANDDENIKLTDNANNETLENVDEDILASESEDVLEHDTEYPYVDFKLPEPNSKVSGVVDISLSVESHSEVKYTSLTIESVSTKQVVFNAQDSNPSDGWGFSWDTSNVANGKYYLTAYALNVLELDDEYSILITLNNQEKNTKIVVDTSTGTVGQSGTIAAHLYDGNSNILSNKELTFDVGGKTFASKTGSDGVALISFTPDEVKNYDVLVKFKGDNLYSPSQARSVLKTLSDTNATIITINNMTGNRNETIKLKANLKAPGFIEDSANKQIDFYVNNKLVGSAVTNLNGDAEFDYNVTEVGGKYVCSAEYSDGEDTFKSFATLFVPESEIYLTMLSNKSNVKIGDKFKITYSLFNLGPDNSTNVVLDYVVPGSMKYIESISSIGKTQYDDNSKEFKWTIDNLPVGNQTLNIIFESAAVARNNLTAHLSTDTYDKSVANGAPTRYLTVKSYAKLVANDLTKYYNGPENYRVYIYGDNGKLVGNGVSVKVTINKKVFNLKSKNGFVDVPVTFKEGKYTSTVECNGLSISNKIVVKATLITKNISKKKSKVVKFTAKVLNTKGKAVKGKKVTFKVKGKKYNVKTNKKGIATLKLKNLKVGSYKVTTTYNKLTVKNTIKIKK